MKFRLTFILISIIAVFIYSCDDSVTFKSNLEQEYAVNLILRGDTTLQIAYVSSNYDVDGYDPDSLKEDPFVDNAILSIKYSDSDDEYFFKDTVNTNLLNSRYNNSAQYYFLNNFLPKSSSNIELEILFDDDHIITGKTTVPENITVDESNTSRYIPGSSKRSDTTNYKIAWDGGDVKLIKAINIKFPYIHRNVDGSISEYTKQVPLSYTIEGTDTTENYTRTTYQSSFQFNKQYLEKALKDISKGDSQKGRYTIYPLEIEIFSLDENLTRFYSSELYFNYGFTVISYPGNLSNVEGGYGFFGSYSYTSHSIRFDYDYLFDNFGYLTE